MSSRPQPQPQPQPFPLQPGKSEALSRSKRAGWFDHRHEWCEQIAWIAQKSAVQMYLLPKLLSLTNRRAFDLEQAERPQTGCTGLFEIKQLAWPDNSDKLPKNALSLSPWEARNFQLALNDLAERGVIERYTREQALDAGLINKTEAGRPRDAYVVRPLTERWKEIAADLAAAAAEDLAQEESDDEPEQTDPAEPEIVQVHADPLVLLPGQKARPLTLTDAVHKRWSRCRTVEFDLAGQVALEHRFTIHGETIRCSIAEHQETKGETQTKCTSLEVLPQKKRTKGETQTKRTSLGEPDAEKRRKGEGQTKCISLGNLPAVADYLTPIFQDLFGRPADLELLECIAKTLDGCPVDDLDGACYARVVRSTLSEFRRKHKPVESGLFLWMAEKSVAAWWAEQKQGKPAQTAASQDQAAQLTAALEAEEAERRRQDEIWAAVAESERRELIRRYIPDLKKRYPSMIPDALWNAAEGAAQREYCEAHAVPQTS